MDILEDKIPTDEELIKGFLDNNHECYRIVTIWIDEIIQRFLWKDSIRPDEVRSDTLYKLLINFRLERFQYNSTLKAYVQQITRFTLIDAVRNHKRQPVLTNSDPPDGNTPFTALVTEEEKNIFSRIWNLVDEKCRELWIMVLKDRIGYKEIARKLKLNENTIKSRVFRCKEEAILIRKKIS